MAELVTIEYLPPRETDELNDPIGPVPEPVPVAGVRYWPRTSVESGTEVILDGYGLKVPARAPKMSALGHVNFRGQTWEIDGVPGDFGRKGFIVYLKRAGS